MSLVNLSPAAAISELCQPTLTLAPLHNGVPNDAPRQCQEHELCAAGQTAGAHLSSECGSPSISRAARLLQQAQPCPQ